MSYPLFRQLFMIDILIPSLLELLARDEGPEGAFFGARPSELFRRKMKGQSIPASNLCQKRQNRPI